MAEITDIANLIDEFNVISLVIYLLLNIGYIISRNRL